MKRTKKKSSARYFLVPGFLLVAPAVLYVLYHVGNDLADHIIETLQKGEIGPICYMFGLAGLVLLFIGGCILAEENEYDMGW